MKCVVTGAAGFVGSHLSEALAQAGHHVLGVDAFIPYYPAAVKERNLASLREHPRFQLHRADLRGDSISELIGDADVIFHLAAMAGLIRSWSDFDSYWTCNAQATQRLLEAIRNASKSLRRLIYVSTSSVYGLVASGDESTPTRPISPYGLTKLAGEHLCHAYAQAYDIPVVVLRYFSVYGPRQRPDMGYYRFIEALLRNEPIIVTGDGEQVRGNTYVDDCVRATLAAVEAEPGEIFNVGGGEPASVWDVLRHLETISGRPPRVEQRPARPGDQRYTLADTTRLCQKLGWAPATKLRDGLARQWEWQRDQMSLN